MNGIIKKLKDNLGNIVFPVTPSKAIYMEDGQMNLDEKLTQQDNKMGILSGLNTTNKTSLVGATNEVVSQLNDKTKQIKDIVTANVKDFGAKGDGVTDDTLAFQNAFNSLGSPANGVLLIPESNAEYYITSMLDFNLGQSDTITDLSAKIPNFQIICKGAIKVGSTPAIGIKIYNGRSPNIQLVFKNGGNVNNEAVNFSNILFGVFDIEGYSCASTLAHFMGGAGQTVLSSRIKKIFALRCGRALWHETGMGSGDLDYVWESACVNASIIACNNFTIKHWEGDLIASTGIIFQNLSSLHIGTLAIGNMSTMLASFKSCQNVTIDKLFLLGNANINDGVKFELCFNVTIGHLITTTLRRGLNVYSSQISVLKHTTGSYLTMSAQNDDTTPIYIDQSSTSPQILNYVDVNIFCGRCKDNIVKIATGSTGQLTISGEVLEYLNTASNGYGILNMGASFKVVADDLRLEYVSKATGAIYSTTPANLEINGGKILNSAPNGSMSTEGWGTQVVKQNTTGRAIKLYLIGTFNPTAGNPAILSGYVGETSTPILVSQFVESNVSNAGSIKTVSLDIPAWWYYKIESSNVTFGQANLVKN